MSKIPYKKCIKLSALVIFFPAKEVLISENEMKFRINFIIYLGTFCKQYKILISI